MSPPVTAQAVEDAVPAGLADSDASEVLSRNFAGRLFRRDDGEQIAISHIEVWDGLIYVVSGETRRDGATTRRIDGGR